MLIKRHLTLFTLTLSFTVVAYFLISASAELINPPPPDPFYRVKGGSWLGYRLGYVGSVLIIVAQIYSIVKRLPSSYWNFMGSRRRWLRIHIALGLAGSILVLIHAGLPFSFKYANPLRYLQLFSAFPAGVVGLSGLATWFLLICVISGFIGRYLYQRLGMGLTKGFRYWRIIHIIFTGSLFSTGIIHLALVVWFRFITI